MNYKEIPCEITCEKCGGYIQIEDHTDPYNGMLDVSDGEVIFTFDFECDNDVESIVDGEIEWEHCGHQITATKYFNFNSMDVEQ